MRKANSINASIRSKTSTYLASSAVAMAWTSVNFALSMLIIIAGVSTVPDFRLAPSTVVLYLVAMVYSFCVVHWNRLGLADTVLAYFLWFPIATVAIYQTATNNYPWSHSHTDGGLLAAIILTGSFILLWTIGTLLPSWKSITLPSSSRQERYRRLAIAGLILSFVLLSAFGGWGYVLSPRFAKVEAEGIGRQLTFTAAGIALSSGLSLVLMYRQNNPAVKRWHMIAVMLYVAVIFNPIANPRFVFVGFVLSTFTAFFLQSSFRPAFKAVTMFLLALGNFFFLGALKMLGSGFSNHSNGFFDTLQRDFTTTLYSVDLDVPQMLANGMTYHEQHGYLSFENILGFVFFFVPRAIWESKPTGSSYQTMGDLGYWFLNLSYPFFMDFFTSGGPIFFLIGITILAWSVARAGMQAKTAAQRNEFTLAAPLYCLMTGFAPIILRGPLNSVVAYFGMAFYWLLAMRLLVLVGRRG